MKKKLLSGMESIAFQSGLFFKELAMVCQEIKEHLDDKPDKNRLKEQFKQLAGIIKSHTGLNPVFEIAEFGPAVAVPDLLKNHSLSEMASRDYFSGGESLSAITTKGGPLKGTVNLKESKVTGFFSEVPFTIYMPTWIFVKNTNFTAAEIASTLLHEVGHVFVYMEYLNRGVTTNVILSALSRKWANADDKEREVILISAAQALKLTSGGLDCAELSKTNKFDIVEAVIVTSVLEQSRSELGGSEYDLVNFEYLSDEFATRHGAGRDIVTALDKLHKFGSYEMAYRSLPKYLMMEVAKVVLLLHPATCIFALLGIWGDNSDNDNVYDLAPDRFRRVRNQLIERVKLKNIPKEHQEQLLQDIAVIDDVIVKLNDRRTVTTLILEKVFTFTKTSRRRKQLELQRELEALAFNNLFIKSAQLDSL